MSRPTIVLHTSWINNALDNYDVEDIAQFIRSSEDFDAFFLDCPAVNEELGRHISDAIVHNSNITKLTIDNEDCFADFDYSFAIRDLVAWWIGSHNNLVNMTSLEHVKVTADDMSELDCTALFPLLLTSASLRKFEINFVHDNGRSDDVMSALLSFLATASLREFEFGTLRLSEADFAALCEGVALSTVRHFTLRTDLFFPEFNLEMAAESLARMISESSLEEVTTVGYFGPLSTWGESFFPALKLTAPVQDMDFAFTQTRNDDHYPHLRINRKWKHFVLSDNTPLALWPHILKKSHVSPETSHDSADIVFYILKQKPDLVPAP